MTKLLSVIEAQQHLLSKFAPLGSEIVGLSSTLSRILGSDVRAGFDFPPFTSSSMDGFAVHAADLADCSPERPARLKVVGDIPAGRADNPIVHRGEAARIMTGALLPDGADAVVPVENTNHHYRDPGMKAPEEVEVLQGVKSGDYLRLKGQDLHAGEVVLKKGKKLKPQDVGVLSMLGVAEAPVIKKPRAAVFSTGDELLPVETRLTPGKIHDSNSYVLSALVEMAGGTPINLGIVEDKPEAVKHTLDQAVELKADVIISSAGVSVGAFDYVRKVIESEGELDFWRVNMRPGKPVAFGSYRGIRLFGLPGNPVSAFVGFEVFIRPALSRMAGWDEWHREIRKVVVTEPIGSDGRESYLRAIIRQESAGYSARLAGHQGSGNLRALAEANALIVIPAGVTSLPAGSEVDAWLLGELGN